VEMRQLRYFIAVAEELSFTRAAVRLHISQPPVSRSVMLLEEEVGVQLLERTKQFVRLTAAGANFYQEARLILAATETAVSSTQKIAAGQSGKLVIGFGGTAAYVMPEVISTFRSRFPDVRLVLNPLNLAYHQAALVDERIDVGLVILPNDAVELQTQRLCGMRLVVALPKEHRLAARSTLALQELADEPFVLVPWSRGQGFGRLVMSVCRRAGYLPQIAQEAEPMEAVVGMVAAGAGISIVPESMQNMHLRRVVYRPLRERYAEAHIALAWRVASTSPTVQAFLSCCPVGAKTSPSQPKKKTKALGLKT
jgi:DNA-binding transcriptional LysR family regulator